MANDTHIPSGAIKSAMRLHHCLAAKQQSATGGNPGKHLVKGGQEVKGGKWLNDPIINALKAEQSRVSMEFFQRPPKSADKAFDYGYAKACIRA